MADLQEKNVLFQEDTAAQIGESDTWADKLKTLSLIHI